MPLLPQFAKFGMGQKRPMSVYKVILKLSLTISLLSLLLMACGEDSQGVALHQAVDANDVGQVQQLLLDGANVNAPETDKTTALNTQATPLIVAAGKEYKAIVYVLIDNGANVNASSIYGSTALSEVAIKGNTSIILALLEAGATVDAPNQWGKTPLMWAADYGHVETVEILLQAGANPLLRDEDGLTALDFAKEGKHQAVIALLSQTTTTVMPPQTTLSN